MTTTLLLASIVLAPQVPTVPLGQADARSSEGFTSIFAVHELADGRVLVTDNLDTAIRIVDLGSGTVRDLGRRGPRRAAPPAPPGSRRNAHRRVRTNGRVRGGA